jgi:endonuclease-3 related protein
MDVLEAFHNLQNKYGHQGWWPILLQKENKICSVYNIKFKNLEKYKTKFRDPYFEIALGALLTQNTSWNNANKALINLYKHNLLTPKVILDTDEKELELYLKPAGYFRQKTKKVKIFSEWLWKKYNGDLSKLKIESLEKNREQLLKLWGIGKETADSIILYALNQPIFIIDVYTKRLCKKYNIEFTEYDEYVKFFEKGLKSLKDKEKIYSEFHALIVEEGKNKNRQ